MTTVNAWAAHSAGSKLEPFTYELGEPAPDDVDISVEYCGLCHSDLSVIDNEWGNAQYPVVPGHEVVGRIEALGSAVKHLEVGQRVGLGWTAESCMHCQNCMSGDHNLCRASQATIVGHHGGFADRVRCSAEWAIPIPEALAPEAVGPMFCGGITVFNPIVQLGIAPTDRVGVIGIGGLGHLAIQFLAAWGCEVTAFSSTADKEPQAREMGAHHFVASADKAALKAVRGRFDAIINTTNVDLNWDVYISALAPRGHLHTVGAVLGAFGPSMGFMLVGGQKSVSGSPLGSPATTATMLDFAARHDVAAQVEVFPMSKVNEALDHLKAGKARYRVVLQAGC